jgi:hypothetical protein
VAHVQDAALGAGGPAATTQQTGAFSTNPTVGNYIIAIAWGWNSNAHNQTPALSDTGGNSYTVPANVYQNQATDLWCIAGLAKVVTSGASFKVTSGGPASGGGGSICVAAAEFSAIPASSPQDGTAAGTTGTSVTVAPGSMTITIGSLVISICTDDNTTYGGSTPTGFTRIAFENDGTNFEVGEGAYAIGPASPTNPSRTVTSAKWAASQFALLTLPTGVLPDFSLFPKAIMQEATL